MIFPNVKVQPHWLKTLEAAAEVLPNCRWLCTALVLGIEPETEQEIREAIAQAIAPFRSSIPGSSVRRVQALLRIKNRKSTE